MKKLLTILTILIFPFSGTFAQQEWAPIGAEWYYTYVFAWSPATVGKLTYTKFISEKDTIVNNMNCRLIHGVRKYDCLGLPELYEEYIITYSENGKVYEIENNQKYLLYDFTKQAGDFWILPKYDNDTVMVISVDSITLLNGEKRKILNIENKNDSWWFRGKIIENIGYTYYIVPYPEIIPCDLGGDFRCYLENGEALIKNVEDCEMEIISTDNKLPNNGISCFYEPNTKSIVVRNEASHVSNVKSIKVYSVRGAIIKSLYEKQLPVSISLPNMAPGIYLVAIETPTKTFNQKILIP